MARYSITKVFDRMREEKTRRDERKSAYLWIGRFTVMRNHYAVITVQGNAGLVKRLLRVLQVVVQFRDATLEYRSEVPGYQRPSYRCKSIEFFLF